MLQEDLFKLIESKYNLAIADEMNLKCIDDEYFDDLTDDQFLKWVLYAILIILNIRMDLNSIMMVYMYILNAFKIAKIVKKV